MIAVSADRQRTAMAANRVVTIFELSDGKPLGPPVELGLGHNGGIGFSSNLRLVAADVRQESDDVLLTNDVIRGDRGGERRPAVAPRRDRWQATELSDPAVGDGTGLGLSSDGPLPVAGVRAGDGDAPRRVRRAAAQLRLAHRTEPQRTQRSATTRSGASRR